MPYELEEEYTVECSGRIILECKGCKENTILLGLEEDWVSERRTDFTCGCGQKLTLEEDWQAEQSEFECQCGRNLTLADRADDEVRAVKKLIRAGMGTSTTDLR